MAVDAHPLSQDTLILARKRVPSLMLNLMLGSGLGAPQSFSVRETRRVLKRVVITDGSRGGVTFTDEVGFAPLPVGAHCGSRTTDSVVSMSAL